MAASLHDQLLLEKLSPTEFVTVAYPERVGNANNIAYGGCALGTGVNAAYQTVQPGYHAYSIQGNYLGPAFNDKKLKAKVHVVRDTRSFATRMVEVGQEHEKDGFRKCMVLIVDFQTQEKASLMQFTSPPSLSNPDLRTALTVEEATDRAIEQHNLSPKLKKGLEAAFGMMYRFFEAKTPAESIAAQNLHSLAARLPTTQDHLHLTEKVSADWKRCKHPLETEGEQVAALAFHMDAALAFVPPMHDHKSFLYDTGACSSLDFSLRLFSNDIRCQDWHYREMKTIHGSEGRTYSEGRLWNQKGNMVAIMTQQSILRPKPEKKGKL